MRTRPEETEAETLEKCGDLVARMIVTRWRGIAKLEPKEKLVIAGARAVLRQLIRHVCSEHPAAGRLDNIRDVLLVAHPKTSYSSQESMAIPLAVVGNILFEIEHGHRVNRAEVDIVLEMCEAAQKLDRH